MPSSARYLRHRALLPQLQRLADAVQQPVALRIDLPREQAQCGIVVVAGLQRGKAELTGAQQGAHAIDAVLAGNDLDVVQRFLEE